MERAGVDEVVPEAPAPQPPERSPDPCEQYHGHDDCCRAGCRLWPSDGGVICMSESHDCALHEGLCSEDERCVEKQTSGRGGCSYHYDVDEVGRCLPDG